MAYKVLLADDSITIQKVVELILSEEDAEVKTVSDGFEALESLEHIRPDIVLADVEMPKMGGYDICRKIKNNPNTSSIPVILLAGAFESFDEDRARGVGAEDFIIKPFDSQDLLEKISKARGAGAASVAGQESVEQPGQMETPAFAEKTPAYETETADASAASFGGIQTPGGMDSLEKADEVVSSSDEFDEGEDFWEVEEVQISDMLSDDSAAEAFSAGGGLTDRAGESGLESGPLKDFESEPKEDYTPEPDNDALGTTPVSPFAGENQGPEAPAFEDVFKDVTDDSALRPAQEPETVIPEPGAGAATPGAGTEDTGVGMREPLSGTADLPEIGREEVTVAIREAVANAINIPIINSDEILLGILKEKVSEVIPDKDSILDMAKIAISAAMPARVEIEEHIKTGIADVLRKNIPAGQDIQNMITSSIQMDEISQEIREAAFEAIEKNLTPIFKTLVEEVLWEVIPGVAEKTVERVLRETMAKDLKETIINVAQKIIPGIAESLITKEIERFRSGE